MAKRKTHTIVTIEVAGRGEFPMDMLRYDMACPVRGEDAARLTSIIGDSALTGYHTGVSWENPIRLHVFTPGGPTFARWLSFGWSVKVMP